MPIRFHCDDCRAKIKVPEGAEGRKVKCPRCGAVHRVPEQVAEKQPVAAAVSENESALDTPNLDEASELDSLASAIGEEEDYSSSPEDELAEDEQYEEDESDEDDDADDEDQPEVHDPTLIDIPGEGEHVEEEDPLAALAAMSDEDDDHESPDSAFSQDLEPDDQEPEDSGALFEEPDADEADLSVSAPPPVVATSKRAIPIPNAKPKPIAQATKKTSESRQHSGLEPEAEARPNVPSPQPRGIPLSSKPSTGRPTAKPIPKGEPVPHIAPGQPVAVASKKQAFDLLGSLGWALRVLAVLAVGGTVKLLLVAINIGWSWGDTLLVLLVGLIASVTVWTVGEIALAVRRMAG